METDPKKSGLNGGPDVFGGGNGVGRCVLRFKKQSRPGDSRRTEKGWALRSDQIPLEMVEPTDTPGFLFCCLMDFVLLMVKVAFILDNLESPLSRK